MANINSPGNFKLDVVGVGFPKCGTSYISEVLASHPKIDFCKIKESNYFSSSKVLHSHLDDMNQVHRVNKLSELKGMFSGNGALKCEFSVFYAYDIKALRRIYAHNKNVKILVCVRDPVEAFSSRYHFAKSSAFSERYGDDINKFIIERGDLYHRLISENRYQDYLKLIYKVFPEEQVLVIRFEDIYSTSEKLFVDISNFLGLKNHLRPIRKKINESYEPRSLKATKYGGYVGRYLIKYRLMLMVSLLYKVNRYLNTKTLVKDHIHDENIEILKLDLGILKDS